MTTNESRDAIDEMISALEVAQRTARREQSDAAIRNDGETSTLASSLIAHLDEQIRRLQTAREAAVRWS